MVERHVKGIIYPRVKFLSDNEEDFLQPDFVGGSKGKQAIAICERILQCMGRSNYSTKQKVMWWIAYRKIIRKKLIKLRSTNVRALQVLFIEGKVNTMFNSPLSLLLFPSLCYNLTFAFFPCFKST